MQCYKTWGHSDSVSTFFIYKIIYVYVEVWIIVIFQLHVEENKCDIEKWHYKVCIFDNILCTSLLIFSCVYYLCFLV